MARQADDIGLVGTIGNICYYKMWGRFYMRTKSSLSRKRVKKSKAFRKTMEYAGWMGRASKIGSKVYKSIPGPRLGIAKYRAITGEAMQLLKKGKTDQEAKAILWQLYVKQEPVTPEEMTLITPKRVVKKKNIYRDTKPWVSVHDYCRYLSIQQRREWKRRERKINGGKLLQPRPSKKNKPPIPVRDSSVVFCS